MKAKGIVLFSGGLDSTLAVKVILEQNIEVLGVTLKTPFFGDRKARTAAKKIGLSLTTIDITEEYLEMLKAPKYGYGKNMNPCIDCHALMLKIAGSVMRDTGADFIFTGEVLGQRPMSQTKQSLHVVAKYSGYQDYVIRPLSAKLLPETKPEIEGKVDREKLLAIRGKGRKEQIELARRFGITDYAAPAGGCLLTDPMFSKRLRDLFAYHRNFRIRDIDLLKYGRHFRVDDTSKIIVGRNNFENEALQRLSSGEDILMHMAQFPGPTVLVPSQSDDATVHYAASLCALYSDAPKDEEVTVVCRRREATQIIRVYAAQREDTERRMI